ncbi:MAG: DUF5004 domain-containing protein [Chitinophagaceae bacterium]|nr:MAG: DUF5004 domain-containing protein [Chitinophagaceae bacterium]
MLNRYIAKTTMVLFSSLVLFSCKKDKEQTRKEKIVGKWQMTAMTETPAQSDLDGDGTNDSDFYHFFEECEKQFIYEFQSDGTYIEDRSSCSQDPNDQSMSTWSMNEEQTVLSVYGQVFDIEEIGSATMSFTINTDLNGVNVKQTSVFTKKE